MLLALLSEVRMQMRNLQRGGKIVAVLSHWKIIMGTGGLVVVSLISIIDGAEWSYGVIVSICLLF
jgi:hypothetical protein